MVASPRRRRSIIEDQKRPRGYIVARYTEAQNAIAEYLSQGTQNDEIIYRAIERLNNEVPATEWEAERNQLCIEALESFLEIGEAIELNGLDALRGEPDPRQLVVAQVAISVRPEVFLRGVDRFGVRTLGAIKLYFAKNTPLTETAALYISTTVHQFVSADLSVEAQPDYQRCMVIDVFNQEVYAAPRAYRRRRMDIEAACEEIARAWPAL
jgi:hypothetical protein